MNAPEKQWRLPLLLTIESECPYLPEQQSRNAFVDSAIPISTDLYTVLLHNGFRRSGIDVYRPYCKQCQACIPVRVVVDEFHANRSQRRTAKRNQDLQWRIETSPLTEAHYQLYARYLEARHADGGMYPPDRLQFDRFLTADWADTELVCLYQDQRLVGVMVADRVLDGVSAVYSFFEPELAERSLGVQLVLSLIDYTRSLGLAYCYLGYYISSCAKMNYKAHYQPIEALLDGKWTPYQV